MKLVYIAETSRGMGHVARASKVLSELARDRQYQLYLVADHPHILTIDPAGTYTPIFVHDLPASAHELSRIVHDVIRADVLVASHWRCFASSMRTAVIRAEERGVPVILAIRDLVGQHGLREAWQRTYTTSLGVTLDRFVHSIAVFGRQRVFDLQNEIPEVERLPVTYCGYLPPAQLRHQLQPELRSDRLQIACAVGGGKESEQVLEELCASWPLLQKEAGADLTLFVGSGSPPDVVASLADFTSESPHFSLELLKPNWFHAGHRFDAIVCPGGYNLLSEAIWFEVPIVCRPRHSTDDDWEQERRSERFRELGLVSAVLRSAAGPDLVDAILTATVRAGRPANFFARPGEIAAAFDGARLDAPQGVT